MARAKTLGKCFEWANASVFQRGTGTCKMGGRVAVGEPAPIQIVFQNKSGHPVQVTNEFWVCPRLCKTFTARYAGWMTIYRKSCQTWRLYVTRKFPVLEPLLLFNLCLSKIGICLRTNAWHHLRRTLIIAQIPCNKSARYLCKFLPRVVRLSDRGLVAAFRSLLDPLSLEIGSLLAVPNQGS